MVFALCSLFTANFAFAQSVNVTIVDNHGKPLPDVVVYLALPEGVNPPVRSEPVEIAQIDKSFSPYVGVMQRGGVVKFDNKDNITHHIYSPIGDNKFSVKISAGQQKLKEDFVGTGEVSMGCNIHDWMSGHLLILDTPYFAKTDTKGVAHIDVSDSATYQLIVWHPQLHHSDKGNKLSLLIDKDVTTAVRLNQLLLELPNQKNDDDFDFLSDY